jgi:hypothetical protein
MKKLFLLTLIISQCVYAISNAQDHELNIEYLFTLGENLEFGDPGFLVNPQKMSSYEDGTFFIADHGTKSVNMYTEDGKFLNSFGRSGRGPGEVREISAISVDENGNLLVLDRMSFKLARFNIDGNSVEEHIFEDMNQINMMTVAALPNNHFAGIYVESGIPESLNKDLEAIRVYEFGNGETKSTHFEIFKHQFDRNIPLEKRLGEGIGYKLTSLQNNVLVVGHRAYTGKLFIVNIKSNEVVEATNKTIKSPYYLMLDPDAFEIKSFDDIPEISGFTASSGSSGKFMYQVLYNSMMLKQSKNMIFHIFERNEKEGKTLSIELEIYSEDGKLLLHKNISKKFPDSDKFRRSFMHVDEKLRLYVTNHFYNDDPEVQVYQLHLNGLD